MTNQAIIWYSKIAIADHKHRMGDKSPKESQIPRSGSSGPTKYDFGDNLYRHSVNNPIIILLRLSEVFPIKPLDTFHFYRIVVVVLVQHYELEPKPEPPPSNLPVQKTTKRSRVGYTHNFLVVLLFYLQ